VARRLRTWALIGAVLVSSSAHALDLPKLWGKPLTLEITEVTIVAQRFDSREADPVTEGGAFGQWINRLNIKLDWNHFTVGARLDSAVYWNTLSEQCSSPTNTVPSGAGSLSCGPPPNPLYPRYYVDDLTRYQNSIYPAKLWATYANKQIGIEATIGDAYVQFARGLVLSMRKLDDLGVDTTLRGLKVSETKGPFAVTVVAGMANPSRVDEATGQALFVEKKVTDINSPAYKTRLAQPAFGADQMFGAELQAGRKSPVILTTSASYINRCSPAAYNNNPTSSGSGRVIPGNTVNDLFGYCDDANVVTWLSGLPAVGNIRNARHVTTVAQAVELPKMGKFGALYAAAVVQQRDGISDADITTFDSGTAIYATYNVAFNKHVDATLEFKDYRNFYPAVASVNATNLDAFSTLAYSAPPTIEAITQDNMFGNFNVCVDGLRERTDVRLNKHVLFFGQVIGTISKTEQNGICDKGGNLTAPKSAQPGLTDYVFDGLIGWQTDVHQERTIFNGTIGGRQDWTGTGDSYVQQLEFTYTFSQKLSKTVAVELIGRHRIRYEAGLNTGPQGTSEAWVEGENYTGLSIAPKWVFTQGFEYTTFELPASTKFAFIDNYPAWLFLSLGGTYKFTKDSNIRVFVGQQRGGLKCISGICRIFPPFEGARAELTLRF
jgi:hypothetical protein